MQERGLPDNTLVIWAHPDFSRDTILYLGQHHLVKELQYPCSEAGGRAVGLLLDALAGRRSWEALFLGVETPQKLAAAAVNASGDLQCLACQGTAFGRQCGQFLTRSLSCWRLPDDKGRYNWLSGKAMDQLRCLQEWQQPASSLQCLRKLLLRAHDPRVLYGAAEGVNENAVADACEEKLSNIKGPIFCLGPGGDQLLARLKARFETHWYTDIVVAQGDFAASFAIGEEQARAQAARLAQYEVHVLVAQPYAQEISGQPRPQRQPRMVLDGAELDTALVNNLLQKAHCTGVTSSKKAKAAAARGGGSPEPLSLPGSAAALAAQRPGAAPQAPDAVPASCRQLLEETPPQDPATELLIKALAGQAFPEKPGDPAGDCAETRKRPRPSVADPRASLKKKTADLEGEAAGSSSARLDADVQPAAEDMQALQAAAMATLRRSLVQMKAGSEGVAANASTADLFAALVPAQAAAPRLPLAQKCDQESGARGTSTTEVTADGGSAATPAPAAHMKAESARSKGEADAAQPSTAHEPGRGGGDPSEPMQLSARVCRQPRKVSYLQQLSGQLRTNYLAAIISASHQRNLSATSAQDHRHLSAISMPAQHNLIATSVPPQRDTDTSRPQGSSIGATVVKVETGIAPSAAAAAKLSASAAPKDPTAFRQHCV